MKLKANKILVISLPIIFATTTLVATVGTMVSCSDNKTDNINSVIETKISSSKINDLGSLISSETSKYTISQFNNYFNGSDSQTRIQNVATSLGIDANVIASIQATGAPTAATITITAASNYKFVLDDTQPSNRNTVVGNIENDGQTIVYNNVSFATIINVSQTKINEFAANLSDKINQLTIAGFNTYFEGDESSNNIQLVANALGITDVKAINSIVASGTYNEGTITISTNNGYKFSQVTEELKSVSGSINITKDAIVFSNVVFAELATITSFVNNINLSQQFITKTSNSQITSPAQTTTNATLLNQGLTIIVDCGQSPNPFFNISLPTNASEIFDLTNTGLTDNLTIEWSKPEATAGTINNDVTFENSLEKSFVYNNVGVVFPVSNSDGSGSMILIVNIMNGNLKVANSIEVTFKFVCNRIVDTSNVIFNDNGISSCFEYLQSGINGPVTYLSATTIDNTINLAKPQSLFSISIEPRTPLRLLRVGFSGLIKQLMGCLNAIGWMNYVQQIWTVTYVSPELNIPNLSEDLSFKGTPDTYSWSPYFTLSNLSYSGTFVWTITFENIPDGVYLTSNQIEITVNVDL